MPCGDAGFRGERQLAEAAGATPLPQQRTYSFSPCNWLALRLRRCISILASSCRKQRPDDYSGGKGGETPGSGCCLGFYEDAYQTVPDPRRSRVASRDRNL